jgi:hypothetical protein
MARLMRSLVTTVICGLLAFGCASEGPSGVRAGRRRDFAVLYADPRLSSARDDGEAIARAEETPTYVPRIPHSAPRVTTSDPTHASFDEAAARAAVGALDPSACVRRGAPTGYVHARVTFGGEGQVSRVVVDAPSGMTDDAVACIEDALGSASMPAFEGGAVTIGASYFLASRH